MILSIESGIPGFDELARPTMGTGGIPENSITLLYGPPKTGKSIFCNQFIYKGLLNDEPGLYITTDSGANQIRNNMRDFNWPIDHYIEDQMLYIIDAISNISDEVPQQSDTIVTSYVNNPTDLMIKVASGVKFIHKRSERYRSVLDSITTLFAFNDNMLITRVLKSYMMKIKGAGGSAVITYTEESADKKIETMIKSMVDNILRLDGEILTVEAMKGAPKSEKPYKIKDQGIIID